MIDKFVKDNPERIQALEEILGYRFREPGHLLTALVHSSFSFEYGKNTLQNNEILEFLGDAVLDLVVGASLHVSFLNAKEGELTRMRAALVNEASLASLAAGLSLGQHLFLGKGEEASGGREKPSLLACAYEALIGAIFMDGGYEAVRPVVERQFAPLFSKGKKVMLRADAKSQLQELIQRHYSEAPVYSLEKEEGPDHDKEFTVSVRFRGTVLAQATAGSKKEAEQRAAAQGIDVFAEQFLDN